MKDAHTYICSYIGMGGSEWTMRLSMSTDLVCEGSPWSRYLLSYYFYQTIVIYMSWWLQARNVLKNTSQNVDIIIARSPEGELNFLTLVVKKTLNCWRRRQRGQKPGAETVDPEKEKAAGDDIQLYCEIFLISLILGDNAHNYCEFRGIFCIIEKG